MNKQKWSSSARAGLIVGIWFIVVSPHHRGPGALFQQLISPVSAGSQYSSVVKIWLGFFFFFLAGCGFPSYPFACFFSLSLFLIPHVWLWFNTSAAHIILTYPIFQSSMHSMHCWCFSNFNQLCLHFTYNFNFFKLKGASTLQDFFAFPRHIRGTHALAGRCDCM